MDDIINNLASLKLNELKDYARENNLKGFSKHRTKDSLRRFIILSTQPKSNIINVLDLFCGAGGMTRGFNQLFNIVLGVDCWDKAIESYNKNYTHLGVCKDLTIYTPKECDKEYINGKSIDIIIGGPPCQSYSMGGKRDPDDPRANLFMDFYKYLQYFKPKVFIMENVMGMLSVKDKNNNLLIDKIMSLLNENYNCIINKLYACDFQVPQLRRRVIIVGIRKDLNILPKPITTVNADNRIAVRTILENREDVDASYYLSERAITGINAKKERMRNEKKGFGAQFLDLNKPSYTIPARYWKDGYDALLEYSDTEIRRLTILELKRIQTFPDDYIICGSKKEQIIQIGNAVACRFAYHIASYVSNIFQELKNN